MIDRCCQGYHRKNPIHYVSLKNHEASINGMHQFRKENQGTDNFRLEFCLLNYFSFHRILNHRSSFSKMILYVTLKHNQVFHSIFYIGCISRTIADISSGFNGMLSNKTSAMSR